MSITWPSPRETFGKDLLASVVVFLVALPLCMGIAIASGMPPATGLITGIVGGILVGAIGGAPLQVSGPAAGLAVIVYQLVADHGIAGVGVIVLLAGLMQILAGVVKLGQVFRAVSPAVIHGMLAGIGVLIFASQFHVMVDDAPRGTGVANLLSIPEAIYKGVFPLDGSTHHQAAAVGIVTIVCILAWLRFAPKRLKPVPAPLVAVLAGVIVAAVLGFQVRFVDVPENLLDSVTLPDSAALASMIRPEILRAAAALAVIASAETLLCATATDQMHDGPRTNYDRELAAQGVGNTICGALGALPMTGVIVRSSANVEAGARTKTSAMLHGVWILVLATAASFVLEVIPVSALAALLVYTGYKLVNVKQIKSLWAVGRIEFLIYALTLVGIVLTDLLTGVMIGVAASIAKLVHNFSRLEVRLSAGRPAGASEQGEAATSGGERYDMWLEGSATFIRLPKLATALSEVPPSCELHVHTERLAYVDHASLDAIMNWERQAERAGGRLVMEWEELRALYRGSRFVQNHERDPAKEPESKAVVRS